VGKWAVDQRHVVGNGPVLIAGVNVMGRLVGWRDAADWGDCVT